MKEIDFVDTRSKITIAIDAGMIVALMSLSFWVGQQSNTISKMNDDLLLLRGQIVEISNRQITPGASREIAVLAARITANEQALGNLKGDIVARLDRIEAKIDRSENHR